MVLFSFGSLFKGLVDLVIFGRKKGWWDEMNKPNISKNERNIPR